MTSKLPDEMGVMARAGAGTWSRLGRVHLWVGLVMLLVALFGSLKVLSHKQIALEAEGEAMRLSRVSRQALMEADVAVLSLLAPRAPADASAPVRTAGKLARFGDEGLPPTVTREGRDVPTGSVVASLRAAWAEIVAAARAGDVEAARAAYATRGVEQATALLVDAATMQIEAMDAVLVGLQRESRVAIAVALILVFLIGLFAYLFATRRAASDKHDLRSAIHAANAAREAADAATRIADSSRDQVTRLFQMTDMLQSAADHYDANAVLRATAADLIPGFGGALYVFSDSRDRLTLSTTWNLDDRPAQPETISLRQCWSLKRGKPHMNVPDPRKLRCEHYVGPDCVLEIPMMARGEIIGLLQIHAAGEDGEARLAAVTNMGAALADGMSLALANISLRDKLRSQAFRDPLTGLYNRRYMEDALQRVVGLADREHTEVSVIMIDLDHFKHLNDAFGHAKGDAVLRDVAAILLHQLRETDVVCRYGGEELIVVMPNCALEMAAIKAERLCASIRALSEPGGAQVSASMGVASYPSTALDTKDLLATADVALYDAKGAGRDRVVAAPRRAAIAGAGLSLVAAE